ncbi:hypothetical protein QAD02_019518 [Eretmocerus hayati]|uniref:Uncharacterized protein n=1 Tax=Eretmocerus hayati TaxID=131215 RepID=A0ACC2PLM9_9HYME|nr:hypothetical protein QAD02_019518 [Eretmocerus hayati]
MSSNNLPKQPHQLIFDFSQCYVDENGFVRYCGVRNERSNPNYLLLENTGVIDRSSAVTAHTNGDLSPHNAVTYCEPSTSGIQNETIAHLELDTSSVQYTNAAENSDVIDESNLSITIKSRNPSRDGTLENCDNSERGIVDSEPFQANHSLRIDENLDGREELNTARVETDANSSLNVIVADHEPNVPFANPEISNADSDPALTKKGTIRKRKPKQPRETIEAKRKRIADAHPVREACDSSDC